jgi:hypothetical protein
MMQTHLSRVGIGLEAGVLLIAASIAAALLRPGWTNRLLGVASDPPQGPFAGAPVAARRVGAVVSQVAGRLPWHPTCLRQALAVRWMLRRRHIACECHIGVVKVAPFQAHVWVTVDGTVVVGGPIRHVTRVGTFA